MYDENYVISANAIGLQETNLLTFDFSKFKEIFNLSPKPSVENAIEKIVELAKAYQNNKDMNQVLVEQIKIFLVKNLNDSILGKKVIGASYG